MIYGYARVSTKHQKLERQLDNIQSYSPEAVIVTEKFSAKHQDRPQWQNLIKRVQSGDTIIFDEISRMSRNAAEGYKDYRALYDMGVNLVFLEEHYLDTDNFRKALNQGVPMTSTDVDCILKGVNEYLMLLAERQIKTAFEHAEYELVAKNRNIKKGIEARRIRGGKVGRGKGETYETKKAKAAKEIIMQHSKTFNGTLKDRDVIKLAEISANSYYKYKRELNEMING